MTNEKISGRGGPRPGSGRKIKSADGPVKALTVTVPQQLVDEFDALCEQQDWGRSQGVTEAIRAILSKPPKKRAT